MKIGEWFSICVCVVLLALALNLRPVPGTPSQTVHEAEEHKSAGLAFAQQRDLKGAEAELRRAVELSPNNPQYLSELRGILGMQQKLEESTTCFEKALKLDPESLVTRRNLASNQWQMGRLEDAKQNLQIVLKSKTGDLRATLLLGMVEESLKHYPRAAELLQSVAELVRQQPESLTALARAYYHTGEKQKARKLLSGLLDHPSGSRGVFLGAQAAADAEDYETAEKLFRSIRLSYPDPAAVGYRLALVQYRQDHFEESRKGLLELIAQGHDTVEIYNLLARCYRKQDNMEEAIHVFNHAIQRIPETEGDYLKLGLALAKNKFYPTAYDVAKRTVEMAPSSEKAYRLKGLIELYMQEFKHAVESFAEAVKWNPESPEANLGLALAQQRAGRTSENGLKRFPRDVYHYSAYAGMLLKTGDPAAELRAVSLLRNAITQSPSEPLPHCDLGNLLLKKGKTQEALKELVEAVRLGPGIGRFHYSLSRAYRRCGRHKEASRELQAFEKLKEEEGDQLYRDVGTTAP